MHCFAMNRRCATTLFALLCASGLAALIVREGGALRAQSQPAPPPRFDAALLARGAQLALLGDCNRCHTAPGGTPYAGGYPIATPLGTIYGTNITPDPETGIGKWSEEDFLRAMQDRVDREGRHLYPVFP